MPCGVSLDNLLLDYHIKQHTHAHTHARTHTSTTGCRGTGLNKDLQLLDNYSTAELSCHQLNLLTEGGRGRELRLIQAVNEN